MLPISICIIARDEAKYLHTCLTALAPYGFEFIIVDTGSKDNTIDVAKSFTHHVFSFPWCDDFSAARNYSIQQATNDWILVVDCDEHLTFIDTALLEQLLTTMNPSTTIGKITLSSSYTQGSAQGLHTSKLPRLFSKSYFHYEGAIHEQIVPLTEGTPHFMELPLCFSHVGYETESIMEAKSRRNISLLQGELDKGNSTAYLYFQMGQSYFTIKEYEKACTYFDTALSFDVNPKESYVQTLVESYGYTLLNLKEYEKALLLENIYDTFGTHCDFVFLMGLIYMNNGLLEDAIDQFTKATTFSTCEVAGVNSYSAFYNIGVIYECTNRLAEARIYYEKAGHYEPALLRLEHLSLINQ